MTQQANIVSGLQKIIVVPNTQKVQIVGVVKGDTGLTGLTGATGPGVPVGGTTNQVLSKINSTNYNTQWVTPVLASSNNAFTGANTFQSINGIVSFYSASTQDGVTILGRNGGLTSLRVSLVPAALTSNKTITLPDASGTAVTTGNLSDITSVGTLTAGTIPATLLSGTIASARISGSYTGLTGVGTLTAGVIPASLLTGTTLPATIITSSLTTIGTLTAGAVPASLLTGTTLPATIVTSSLTSFGTVTSMTVNGANASSPAITIGDWNQNGDFTAIRSAYGYLLFGSANGPNYNLYLRTETATGNVVIGGGGSASTANNTMVVGATSVSVTGTMSATTFSGSGASLTSLPAGSLTGTVANAQLPTAINISSTMQSYSYQGNANVAGTGNASYHPSGIYSTGSNWLYGTTFLNGGNIGDTSSTMTGAGQVYANGWFRSWGDTGWYNQSYGGGIYMVDTTFVRVYNSKIFYAAGGLWSVDTGTASTTGFQYLLRGTLYGNYAPFTSMREVKRNIEIISNSGLLIDQLNPVTFQEKITDTDDEISIAWKDADLEYGFIADEVAQVGTGHLAQYESMDDGTLKPVGWSFHGVVSVLVAEVKDLRKRLQLLENK